MDIITFALGFFAGAYFTAFAFAVLLVERVRKRLKEILDKIAG